MSTNEPNIDNPVEEENKEVKENQIVEEESKEVKEDKTEENEDDVLDLINREQRFYDVRIATMGNVDAGKSTLVGVLTSGQLDNGRGLARSRVFRMRHEQDSGRTSAISQHIFGFNTNNEAVHQPVVGSATAAAKTKSWRQVMQNSKSSVTLIDLAGHEKYLKTTIAGLTGMYVDYACLIVGGNMGISKMTKEHLGVALALEIPCFVVITKIDMTPPDVLKETVKQLFKILKSPAANKMPIIIRSAQDIETTVNSGAIGTRVCPIFLISSVKGTNVDLLMSFVSKLKPRYFDPESGAIKEEKPGAANEFDIDEVFQVAGVGVVVSGTVKNGTILLNQKLLLGPCSDSTFKSVMVKSIHMKRVPVDGVRRGDSCAMALRPVKRKDQFSREDVRRGMVLVDSLDELRPSKSFDAEVLVLTHHTTIKPKYQPVIHCGNIRQTAVVESIDKEIIRTGDKALVKFRFLVRPEYLHVGTNFVFREGNTKGIGKVLNVSSDA